MHSINAEPKNNNSNMERVYVWERKREIVTINIHPKIPSNYYRIPNKYTNMIITRF